MSVGEATASRSVPPLEASSRRVIRCAHQQRLVYRGHPLVMGILNVTPDSFSDGMQHLEPDAAIERGIQMEEEDADLIDVGGESTRPGAVPVAAEDELRRVLPVIRRLAKSLKIPISVDTSKADVARQALDVGAAMVNDVSALRADQAMASVVARSKAAVILMHMRGTPATMQRQPRYRNVTQEVQRFLLHAAQLAEAQGIERSRIVLDPGLGFGKTLAHNMALVREIGALVATGYPVLLGPSRKQFIGAILKVDVCDRLAGTLACVAHAQRSGVHMVRVHEVKPAVQLIRMLHAIEPG